MTCECSHVDQVALDDFLPYVLPSINGVPTEIAAHNIRLSAIQFARETQMLERTVWLYAQAGVSFYPIELPDCYDFLSVRKVHVLGCRYEPVRTLEACLGSRSYFYEHGHGLHVGQVGCDAERGIEVQAKVVPGQDTCFVDRCLYDVYAEAIEHGAKQRLFSMASAEWFDLQLARYHRGLYQEMANDAKVLNTKAHSSEPLMMKARRFV